MVWRLFRRRHPFISLANFPKFSGDNEDDEVNLSPSFISIFISHGKFLYPLKCSKTFPRDTIRRNGTKFRNVNKDNVKSWYREDAGIFKLFNPILYFIYFSLFNRQRN